MNLWPRPLQSPHPPIAVAGSPETMRWVAENRYMYVSNSASAAAVFDHVRL